MSGCRLCCSKGLSKCLCHEKFTKLSGFEIDCTLVSSLTPVADCIRDLATQLGARPYRVSLIWTRWSGGERGIGAEDTVRVEEILPTPKCAPLSSLKLELTEIGLLEAGTIRVTQISARYTEDFLMGKSGIGEEIPRDQNFYYEVEFLRSDGPGPRRRFIPVNVNSYNPLSFDWTIDLIRAAEDRTRNMESRG